MPEGIPLCEIDGVWTNGHLRFDPASKGWEVRLASSGTDAEPVGRISWHWYWQEWVLRTADGYAFAHECLSDIARFCQDRNKEK